MKSVLQNTRVGYQMVLQEGGGQQRKLVRMRFIGVDSLLRMMRDGGRYHVHALELLTHLIYLSEILLCWFVFTFV